MSMMQGGQSNPNGGGAWVLRENYSRIMHLYFCPLHFSVFLSVLFFPFNPILSRSAVVSFLFGIVYCFPLFCLLRERYFFCCMGVYPFV